MPNQIQRWKAGLISMIVLVLLVTHPAEAQTYTEKVLHSFAGSPDGDTPLSGVIGDSKGNIYGTTYQGGASNLGTVFKLGTSGKEILYSLQGDGSDPYGGLLADAVGNLYGTAEFGGDTACVSGCGVVFKIDSERNETLLHTFTGGMSDGCNPAGRLIRDKAGNLYGTTVGCGTLGYGTVFKLAENGTETVLYSFAGAPVDGEYPQEGVIMDAKGNLYGTTQMGGPDNNCAGGCGTVFKLDMTGNETVLYSFDGGVGDEEYPSSGVIMDARGNLYGTTADGPCGEGYHACGWVFRLSESGTLTVLYRFTGGADGWWPIGGVIMDAKGNLYGTAALGGAGYNNCSSGCGTVFKLSTRGGFTVLYSFAGGEDGMTPRGGVIVDAEGNLYGTTAYGGGANNCYGQGCGTVWKLTHD